MKGHPDPAEATHGLVERHRGVDEPGPPAAPGSPATGPDFAPSPLTQAVLDLSVPYQDRLEAPGHLVGAADEGEVLMTADLDEAMLPYSAALQIRPREAIHSLPQSIPELVEVPLKFPRRRVALASAYRSGAQGTVRVAELRGEPVAAKTYMDDESGGERMLQEARAAQVLSDLGIGPRFRGVYRDTAEDRWYVVTDLIPGDFRGMEITRETLRDAEEILRRLDEAGCRNLGELEVYRTPGGRLLVIDGAGLLDPAPAEMAKRYATEFRADVLSEAAEADAEMVVEHLRSLEPAVLDALRELAEEDRSVPLLPLLDRAADK